MDEVLRMTRRAKVLTARRSGATMLGDGGKNIGEEGKGDRGEHT